MKRARELDIEIPTALELIHQQTRRIQSDVNEVSLIIGTAYNSANVEETIRDIDVVSGILGSTASPEFTKRLSEVKQKLLQGGQVPSIIADPDVPTAKIFRTVTCPKCGKNIKARIHLRPGDTETSAVCLECYSRIGILLPNLTAELRGSLEVIKDPQILGKSGSRPVTACPRCTKRISAQIERDETYFAICRDDDTMTVVSREAFQTWRNSAEA